MMLPVYGVLAPLLLAVGGLPSPTAPLRGSASAPPPEMMVPPVQLVEESRPYKVQAATFEELRAQLRSDGALMQALGSHGLTASRIEVRYEFDSTLRPCRVQTAEISAHVVVTVPEWMPERPLTAKQRHRWDRWSAALRRHEAKHAADAVAAARELRVALLGLLPRDRCRDANWDVRRLIDRTLLKLHLKGLRFDEATDHGKRDSIEL